MIFRCELCGYEKQYDPISKNNAMPDNWHRWIFLDENKKAYRILICSDCTIVLRGDYHFSSHINIEDIKEKPWLGDLRKKIEKYIENA
jgi:hypothetical protein